MRHISEQKLSKLRMDVDSPYIANRPVNDGLIRSLLDHIDELESENTDLRNRLHEWK